MIAADSYEPGFTGLSSFGGGFSLIAGLARARLAGAERDLREIDAVVRKQLRDAQHDRVADRRAVLHLDRVDRVDQRSAIARRALHDLRVARERDERDVDVPRQLAQEALRPPSCAATMRVGLTSLTRMLSETSIARMTVVRDHGSVTIAVGRAAAKSSSERAIRSSAGGTWRRHIRRSAAARTTSRLL
jgi:hypothetical protein